MLPGADRTCKQIERFRESHFTDFFFFKKQKEIYSSEHDDKNCSTQKKDEIY